MNGLQLTVMNDAARQFERVSVIIPARNESAGIERTVAAVRNQAVPGVDVEVIVVDDHSTDDTARLAARSGARVLATETPGSPGAARNLGAQHATGDPLVFLDADCVVADGWLSAILSAHAQGETIVSGSLDIPAGLSFTARSDYYSGWYLAHPDRPRGEVPHAPAPNVSVLRRAYFASSGFDSVPYTVASEERGWQAELREQGHRICFVPEARAFHYNRPGLSNLVRRGYRWGFAAIESKSETGSARFAWLYRYPRTLIAASLPLSVVHTSYILLCWLKAGRISSLAHLPLILLSQVAYAVGMSQGGLEWLRTRQAL